MLKKLLILAVFVVVSYSSDVCANLNTDKKIIEFVNETRKLNPISKKDSSALLEIKTDDRKEEKKYLVHLTKHKDKSRIYFDKGEYAPKCFIVGDKNLKCGQCGYDKSTLCREIEDTQVVSKLNGTNIDMDDFKILDSNDYRHECFPVKRRAKYIKIISTKVGTSGEYSQVISFYEIERKLPISRNYYLGKQLRKVYRFFPKQYKKVNDQWMATIMQVRSVMGRERNYQFETVVTLERNSKFRYLLYNDIKEDPLINKVSIEKLFQGDK